MIIWNSVREQSGLFQLEEGSATFCANNPKFDFSREVKQKHDRILTGWVKSSRSVGCSPWRTAGGPQRRRREDLPDYGCHGEETKTSRASSLKYHWLIECSHWRKRSPLVVAWAKRRVNGFLEGGGPCGSSGISKSKTLALYSCCSLRYFPPTPRLPGIK